MVGTPATAASPTTRAEIGRYHVGNVMLTGRSSAGTSGPARVAARMQAAATPAATHGVRLLVSTDQEGGAVQVLGGPGLAPIPSGLAQGRMRPERLRERGRRLGPGAAPRRGEHEPRPRPRHRPGPGRGRAQPADRRLRPGVRLHAPGRRRATARRSPAGMADAGVVATAKHFPGLGRVRANPDVSSGVTDPVTGPRDPYLAPFRDRDPGGRPGRDDVDGDTTRAWTGPTRRPSPGPWSTACCAGELGFRGVVVSDDLGNARQVARYPYGARARALPRAGRRPGADRRPVHAAGHVPRRAGPDPQPPRPSASGWSRPPCGCSRVKQQRGLLR